MLQIPELVARVIDYLHDDHPSLYATSLVARLWTARSQHYLLRSIIIYRDRWPDMMQAIISLHQAADASPALGLNIIRLTLRPVLLQNLTCLRNLLDLTSALPRLQELDIEQLLCNPSTQPLPLLSGRQSLRLLKLQPVDLTDGVCAMRLLQAYPHITTLHIWLSTNPGLDIRDELSTIHSGLPQGVSVERMVLEGHGHIAWDRHLIFLHRIISEDSPKHLTFAFQTTRVRWSQVSLVCESFNSRLEELHINMPGYTGKPSITTSNKPIKLTLSRSSPVRTVRRVPLATPKLREFRIVLLSPLKSTTISSSVDLLVNCIRRLCDSLRVGDNSTSLKLIQYDLSGPEPKGESRPSRVIRTIRALCRGAGGVNHTYHLDVLFDETSLMREDKYREPEDLIYLLHTTQDNHELSHIFQLV